MIWAMSPNIRIKLDKKNLKNKISFGVEMRGFSTGGRRENPWSEREGKKREIKKISKLLSSIQGVPSVGIRRAKNESSFT